MGSELKIIKIKRVKILCYIMRECYINCNDQIKIPIFPSESKKEKKRTTTMKKKNKKFSSRK